jgi:hypothetical protein
MRILWEYYEYYENIMRILWEYYEYYENIMRILWEYYGNIMRILWEYYEDIMSIMRILWEYYENIMGILWEYYEKFSLWHRGASEVPMLPHSVSFLTDSFRQKTNTSWQCVLESKTSLVKPIMCLVIKCNTLCPFFLLSLLPTSIFFTPYFFPLFKALPIQKYKELVWNRKELLSCRT